MTLSLNNHIKLVLEEGFELLCVHHDAIIREWEEILHYMKLNHKKSAHAFEFAFHFFSDSIRSKQHDMDELILEIRAEWFRQFQRPPEPNLLIFILTLLENAVHKVIKSSTTRSFHLHPSVQFLFSKICEEMLAVTPETRFDIQSFCDQIVKSEQLQVEWIASVVHVENGYKLKKVTGMEIDPSLYEVENYSWFLLTEKLLSLTICKEKRDIFSVPWKNETLLFCTTDQNIASIVPFLTYAMHLLQMEEERQRKTANIHWKDAVILFNEWIIQSSNLNEAIRNIAYGYAQYLPFKRCAIFKISGTNKKGEGLFGYHFNNEEIQSIQESIDNIPSLYRSLAKLEPQDDSMKYFQPIYFSDASNEFPFHYVKSFQLGSVVVSPIYVPAEGRLMGAAILDQGPDQHFDVDHNTFTALLKFGQSAGELLSKFAQPENWPAIHSEYVPLSSREIDVLELLAEGASTTEAAEKLHLSEYTVRDYISHIMKRLNARNRTEAAVKAIRLGIIK